MAGGSNPTKAILFAFFANLGIAIAKFVGFSVTGSSSMMAEAIHSSADTGNQLLLLLGMRQSKKEPTIDHPLGYGKSTFFWSFIVAILLFTMGGLFSLYEGYHRLEHAGAPENAWVAIGILVVAILLEAVSLYGCMKEVNKIRGDRSIWRWLKESRSAELVVVFGEDLGALFGLIIALLFLCTAVVTGDGRYDAYGSMAIGLVLFVIALFLAARIHDLLIGRSASPELQSAIQAEMTATSEVTKVFNVITLQMGPQIMVAAKLGMSPGLSGAEACRAINALEARLRERFPEIRWSFIEPDVED